MFQLSGFHCMTAVRIIRVLCGPPCIEGGGGAEWMPAPAARGRDWEAKVPEQEALGQPHVNTSLYSYVYVYIDVYIDVYTCIYILLSIFACVSVIETLRPE